jgi:hypothetical protein
MLLFRRALLAALISVLPVLAFGAASISQQSSIWTGGQTSVSAPALTPTATGDALVLGITAVYAPVFTPSESFAISGGSFTPLAFCSDAGANYALTFQSAPAGTSASLTANFSGTTGSNYIILFSDGEVRRATLTNGSEAVTFGTAISGSPNTQATATPNGNVAGIFVATNVPAVSTTVTASAAIANVGSLWVGDATGVATSSVVLGADCLFTIGPGTGANAISSGTVTFSQSALLVGLGVNVDGSTSTNSPLAGTGFTGLAPLWGTPGYGLAEYETASSSAAATFTAPSGDGVNNFIAFGVALSAYVAPSAPNPNFLLSHKTFSQWTQCASGTTMSAQQPSCLCNASSGAVTIYLPSAAGVTVNSATTEYRVLKTDSSSNACLVKPSISGQEVDGYTGGVSTTVQAPLAGSEITEASDGSNWW